MKKIILAAFIVSSISSPIKTEWEPKSYFVAGAVIIAGISFISATSKYYYSDNKGLSERRRPTNQTGLLCIGACASSLAAFFYFATSTK